LTWINAHGFAERRSASPDARMLANPDAIDAAVDVARAGGVRPDAG
jgi:hypothetical protein